MSNVNQVKQSTSATGSSPQKQRATTNTECLLIEPLSSPTPKSESPLKQQKQQQGLLASAPPFHNKENTQVQQQQQQQTLKSGDKNKQQLGSLVRNASNDLLGSGSVEQKQQQQQQQWQKSRLEAEFADDSIRSQSSAVVTPTRSSSTQNNQATGTNTTTRRSSPPSSGSKSPSSSIKQQQQQLFSRSHHSSNQQQKQQQQPPDITKRAAFNDSGIEASTSHSEARRLLESSSTTNNENCVCCRQLNRDQEAKTHTIESMSLASQTIKLLPAYFVAELIGTFLLVLIGDGAAAAYVLTKRPTDVFCVCFAFGVGAMIASFVSGKLSGAHLNPAATVAFALDSKLKWELVPVYIIAQYVGGFLAALVLFLNYSEAINSLDGGARSSFGETNSTGGIFATYPAPYVTVWGSLLDQIVGTAVLLFSLTAVGDKRNMGLEERFQPPIVALVVGLVCLAFSPNCGAIFNPARDLSPRLLTAIFGYPLVWSPVDGTYWVLAGVVGPHIGAVIGVFAYKYLIGAALEANKRHMQMIQNSVVISSSSSSNGGGVGGFDEKKAPRLQAFTHHGAQMMTTTTPTAANNSSGQRRQELSDYGSAVMR